MIPLFLSELADALNGQLIGEDRLIRAVTTDSRNIGEGALFVALHGARFDGHDYVEQAIADGANALLVDHALPSVVPQIVVDDTRLALGLLGALVRKRVAPRCVAVTGSCGKTTVKEMVAAILSQRGKVLATAGNFNNDIGVPLTLLRLEHEHDYAVLELGASQAGDIAYTCSLVEPEVALITLIAEAHIEGFGDLYGVARAKGEIFTSLQSLGTAVIPVGTPYEALWASIINDRHWVKAGRDDDADFRAEMVTLDGDGCAHFELVTPEGRIPLHLPLPGIHNVDNALKAAAAVAALGIPLEQIASGLAAMQPVNGRLNRIALPGGGTLYDDTYNANAASVRAAIDLLSVQPGQKALILGDMAELGHLALSSHEQVGEYARQKGLDRLFTVGELSRSATHSFGGGAQHFRTIDSLTEALEHWLEQQQTPLLVVKGSRSARMERVVEAIRLWADRQKGESPAC